MDTRVAYWTEDANGGLVLFNMNGQKLSTVPVTQAASYIAAYTQGNPAATDLGKSFAGTSATGTTARAAAAPAPITPATLESQRQFDLLQGERKAREDAADRLAQSKFERDNLVSDRNYDLAVRQHQASLRGPDNYVKYWQDSRGQGAQAPAWAQSASASPSAAPAPAATAAAPAWTQAAPGWQQGQSITSPTVADLAAHGPTTATTFTGQNGAVIDFSNSDWMKKQTAAAPNWAR